MPKFNVYTFYKADGTKIPLYGYTPQDALDSAGFSLDDVTENIRDYRRGFDNSLVFINGKWHQNEPQEKKEPVVDIPIYSYNQN